MAKLANRQPVLKPQDLLVLLALLSHGDGPVTLPELAARTGLAVSAVHASLSDCDRRGSAGGDRLY